MAKRLWINGRILFGFSRMFWIGLIIVLILLFRSSKATSQPAQALQIPTQVNDAITQALSGFGLDSNNVRFWIAVSALETDFWTSQVYIENNNLFGMRLPSSNTTATFSQFGFAGFDSLEDSATDLTLYFDRLKWNQVNYPTLAALVAQMKSKNYFEESADEYLMAVSEKYSMLF